MKLRLIIIVITVLACAGCGRDTSKSAMDSSTTPSDSHASPGSKVAATAEQIKEDEKKVAAKVWGECAKTAVSTVATTSISENCPDKVRSEGGCLRYEENIVAKKYPGLICRRGEKLVFKLSNGDLGIVQNNTDDSHVENFVSYFFNKYFPDIHYGLLYKGFYEGGTYELVDLKTGTRTDVGGDVVLSQDKRRLAAFFSDLEAGFSPNVLSVYLITPNGLIEEFKSQPEEWGPDDLEWIDGKIFEFNKTTFNGVGFHKEKHNLRFLGEDISKQGIWKIEGDLQVEKERMLIKLSDIEALV